MLVEIIIDRAVGRADVDDHRMEERGDRLGHGSLVGVWFDRKVETGHAPDLVRPAAGRVDHDLGVIFALVRPDAADGSVFHDQSGDGFAEAELRPGLLGRPPEGMGRKERRGAPVVGRVCSADQPLGIEVGDDFKHRLPVEPVDIQAERLLGDQKLLESLFLLAAVGDEHVSALAPFDVVAAAIPPGRENLKRAQAEADFGRVGVGRPDSADGPLVRSLADAGHPVDDEDAEAAFGHGQGGRRSDAARADDDDVRGGLNIGHDRLLPGPAPARCRRRSPAGPP